MFVCINLQEHLSESEGYRLGLFQLFVYFLLLRLSVMHDESSDSSHVIARLVRVRLPALASEHLGNNVTCVILSRCDLTIRVYTHKAWRL